MTTPDDLSQRARELAECLTQAADLLRALADERDRLVDGIEELVSDEVISAGRARELHGLSIEQQRAKWWRYYHAREHGVEIPSAINPKEPTDAD